jgi:ribonuclease HII
MSNRLFGIAGVDEAGRGPMIGPMVVCGVLIESKHLPSLKRMGARDSKVLSPRRRAELSQAINNIATKVELEIISAYDIDSYRKKMTLNEIEVRAFIAILKKLRPEEAYLDAADVKADRFGTTIGDRSGLTKLGCKIISEHKADAKYPIVSAASIVAKHKRDSIIESLHHEYGDFGSGYPADPKTVEFVKGYIIENKKLPLIIRTSWESVKKLEDKYRLKQSRLDRF